MEKTRQIKILSIVALVVAIAGMTLGFAAFSTTLSISSSATVTPNSDDFKVVISGNKDDPYDLNVDFVEYNGASAGDCFINNYKGGTSVSTNVNFTEPGQYVIYDSFIHNLGKYVAYFDKIIFENIEGTSVKKRCVPIENGGANPELVERACDSIKIVVITSGDIEVIDSSNFTGLKLSPGVSAPGSLKIIYEEDGVRADGPFSVEFGDIKLVYSSVDT